MCTKYPEEHTVATDAGKAIRLGDSRRNYFRAGGNTEKEL